MLNRKKFLVFSAPTAHNFAWYSVLGIFAMVFLISIGLSSFFMPNWLQAIASVNPISYTIDAVRRLMVYSDGFGPLPLDFAYVGIFAVVLTAVCVVLSWRYLNK